MKMRRKPVAQKIGRPVGQMRPFTSENIQMLENLLKADGSSTSIRDLALLRVGLDTMLRSVDITGLLVGDVFRNGSVVVDFSTKQQKTKKPVHCELVPRTRDALAAWLDHDGLTDPMARVFAISTRQHQRIIKQWCALLRLDGAVYSTHSIRRTKPSVIYAKTQNVAAISKMLGHANTTATMAYLGVTDEDARKLAREFDV
jgi:integrase